MLSLKRFVYLSVLLSLLFSSVPAQQRAGGNRADWNNLRKLKTDARIYVKTKQGAEYEGTFKGATDDALLLTNVEDAPTAYIKVMREEVKEVRKKRSSWVAGPLASAIGIGAGIGIGVVAGAIAESRFPAGTEKGLAPALLGVSGAILGGAVGGVVLEKPLSKGKKIYIAQ